MPKKIRFIDCGANVGKAIDWAAKKYKDDLVRIDAFEPEYHNYTALLDKYLQDPELSQVLVIHTQAVWTQNTIKDFYIQAGEQEQVPLCSKKKNKPLKKVNMCQWHTVTA